ncbi:MAG: helix-turn-helix transcriptional regulator [Thermoanaerobacterales bacterium]|nr:helix-turn-helix transcriptional regulator [Thermoanaerobacterales bacterium]
MIGDTIRALRKQRNLTQVELALLLGVSQAELSRMECNKTTITVQDISKLAAALGVPVTALFDGGDEAPGDATKTGAE